VGMAAAAPGRGEFLRAAGRGWWAVWGSRGRVPPRTVRDETGFGRSQAAGDEIDK